MNIKQKLASYGLTLILVTGTAAAAPGQPYSDEWLAGRISGALAYNTAFDSSDVTVDADGGVVTLKGKVPSEIEREFAERIARLIDGVTSVKNEITVDESMASNNRASMRQKFTDAAITASVKSKLLASRHTHGLAINVDTEGNVVTLNGNVDTAEEKAIAEKLAYETSGVREVRNNLSAAGNARVGKNEESKDTATAFSDAWISTKVRSMLNLTNDFPGSAIDVTTTNGKVTLQGVARTPDQKRQIESTVADVIGVKGVDNRLNVRKGMM